MDFTKLVEFFKLGKRPSFILAGIGWVFLLLPDGVREVLGITELSLVIEPYIGSLTLIFSAYLIFYLLYEVIEKGSTILNRKLNQRREKRKVLGWLTGLSSDEKMLLKTYIQAGTKTQYFSLTDGIAAGLTVKGILYQPTSAGFLQHVAHNIQDVVFEHLAKHSELLK